MTWFSCQMRGNENGHGSRNEMCTRGRPLPYDHHPIVVAMRSFRRHELRSVTRVMTCVRVEEGVLC